jgi:hypothetical protein
MKYVSCLILTLVLSSCASRKEGWQNETKSVSLNSTDEARILAEAKALWSGRVETANLRQSLAKFEELHRARPMALEPLIYLTRGNYFLADSQLDEAAEKKKTYERAAAFGEKAMATNSEFRKLVASGKPLEESLSVLTVAEVPAIYWTAASLGKWAKASGITAALKYKTRIKAMIERVEKLQPDYFYGAVTRYWGGYYSVAPSFAGGDVKKSRVNFDRSIAAAPEYLGTKVLMAEVYATKIQDRKLFDALLREVLLSQEDRHPQLGPENTWEKKKAQRLLNNADELF